MEATTEKKARSGWKRLLTRGAIVLFAGTLLWSYFFFRDAAPVKDADLVLHGSASDTDEGELSTALMNIDIQVSEEERELLYEFNSRHDLSNYLPWTHELAATRHEEFFERIFLD